MNEVERARRIDEIEQLVANTRLGDGEQFSLYYADELITIAREAEAERRALSVLGEAATTETAASAADEYIRILEEYWGIPKVVNEYNTPVTHKAREAYLLERAAKTKAV